MMGLYLRIKAFSAVLREKQQESFAKISNTIKAGKESVVSWVNMVTLSVVSVLKQTKDVVSAVTKIIFTPINKKRSLDFLLQAWVGFSRFLNPQTLIVLILSPFTRRVLKDSLIDNAVFYLSAELFLEAAAKPLCRKIPYLSDAELVIEIAATLFIARLAMRRFMDNTLYNVSMAKALYDESPRDPSQGCDCDEADKTKGKLTSIFYFISNLAIVKLVAATLPFGHYIASLLRAWAYGQTLAEYNIAANGMCSKHRYEVLNKNNAYCIGLGASLVGLTELSCFLIKRATGAESIFIYDALFSWLFQYHIMLSYLQGPTLPGQKTGVDVFYYGRVMMQDLLKHLSDNMDFQTTEKSSITDNIKSGLVWRPVRAINKIILGTDFQKLEPSIDNFAKWSSVKCYLALYGNKIQSEINNILTIRSKYYVKGVKWASPYLPDFIVSKPLRKKLDVVMSKELGEALHTFNYILQRAQKKPERLPIGRLFDREIAVHEEYVGNPDEKKPEIVNDDNWDDWTSIASINSDLKSAYPQSIELPAVKKIENTVEEKKAESKNEVENKSEMKAPLVIKKETIIPPIKKENLMSMTISDYSPKSPRPPLTKSNSLPPPMLQSQSLMEIRSNMFPSISTPAVARPSLPSRSRQH